MFVQIRFPANVLPICTSLPFGYIDSFPKFRQHLRAKQLSIPGHPMNRPWCYAKMHVPPRCKMSKANLWETNHWKSYTQHCSSIVQVISCTSMFEIGCLWPRKPSSGPYIPYSHLPPKDKTQIYQVDTRMKSTSHVRYIHPALYDAYLENTANVQDFWSSGWNWNSEVKCEGLLWNGSIQKGIRNYRMHAALASSHSFTVFATVNNAYDDEPWLLSLDHHSSVGIVRVAEGPWDFWRHKWDQLSQSWSPDIKRNGYFCVHWILMQLWWPLNRKGAAVTTCTANKEVRVEILWVLLLVASSSIFLHRIEWLNRPHGLVSNEVDLGHKGISPQSNQTHRQHLVARNTLSIPGATSWSTSSWMPTEQTQIDHTNKIKSCWDMLRYAEMLFRHTFHHFTLLHPDRELIFWEILLFIDVCASLFRFNLCKISPME